MNGFSEFTGLPVRGKVMMVRVNLLCHWPRNLGNKKIVNSDLNQNLGDRLMSLKLHQMTASERPEKRQLCILPVILGHCHGNHLYLS